MANGSYGNIYWAGWQSMKLQGYVYIDKLGYSGASTKLYMPPKSMEIVYAFSDWNNPIIPLQATFKIINDRSNYYELLPLLSIEEQQFKVRIVIVYPYTQTLFEGFLNTDTITQKILLRQTINFAASQYLLKMDNNSIYPQSINTLENKTFISIIDEILRRTGLFFNIRINSSLHTSQETLGSLDTLFNKNGFYTELFWTDNISRTTCLAILKSILTSFDCYLYWYDGFWYIERFEDMWKTSKTFVEYATGTVFSSPSVGGSSTFTLSLPAKDVHSTKFQGQTQTNSILPGLQVITINLQDKKLINLVTNIWKSAFPLRSSSDSITFNGLSPNPGLREWLYLTAPHPTISEYTYTNTITHVTTTYPSPYIAGTYDLATWSNFGISYMDILNAVQRNLNNYQVFLNTATSSPFIPPLSRYINPWHPFLPYTHGLSTRFRLTSNASGIIKGPTSILDPTPITINVFASASLSISWKVNGNIARSLIGSFAVNTFKPSEWTVDFHYYIKVAGTSNYLVKSGTNGFTASETALSQWALMPCSSELVAMQTISVSAGSFDPVLHTATISDTIPIGNVVDLTGGSMQSTLKGDYDFIILIGSETFYKTGANPEFWNDDYPTQFLESYWGDFNITVNSINQPNRIEGLVNNNFLNTKEISLDLFDCNSLNYKNGILYGSTLQYRTTIWGSASGSSIIVSKGITWNTTGSPTIISDLHTSDLEIIVGGSSTITGLLQNTTYHIRAYATDGSGTTIYGNEITFTTAATLAGSIVDNAILFYQLQPGDQGYVSGVNKWIGAAKEDCPINGTGDALGRFFWSRLTSGYGTYIAGSYQWNVGWAADNSNIQNTNNVGAMKAIETVDIYGGGFPYNPTTLTPGTLGSGGGLTPWYFPTVKELLLMRAYNQSNPAIPIPKLNGAGYGWYWSSTESHGAGQYENGHLVAALPRSFTVQIPGVTGTTIIPGIGDNVIINVGKYAMAVCMYDPNGTNLDHSTSQDWQKNNWMSIRCIKYVTVP